MKKNRVGIDLGTTYSSLCCLSEDDKPTPIANSDGEMATPSVVFFPGGGKKPIVGKQALRLSAAQPHRFVAHTKRFMGSKSTAWEIDDVVYTPVDIAAIIVRKLLQDAESDLGSISEAVITVPAHFTGYQRQLTIQAGKQAGLNKVSVVNEPVAAALAYVLADVALADDAVILLDYLDHASTILVYDLGGGTFDLSMVRYDKTQLRVLATNGEQKLGGLDFDQELVNIVAEPLEKLHRGAMSDPTVVWRMARAAEQTKRALSSFDKAAFRIAHDGWEEEFELTRAEFEQRTAPLVDKSRGRTEELLARCGLTWDDVDALVPVGGSVRMPMVQRLLEDFAASRRVKKQNFIRQISPDLSVATGAALFAGMQSASGNGASVGGRMQKILSGYRMQNVSTNTLGIVVRENGTGQLISHPLIQKNSALPASSSVRVETTHDNQERATIKIVEGEWTPGGQRPILCRCTIDHLPPGLPKGSTFDVDLMYDMDGLLHVVVNHPTTGRLVTATAVQTAE